MNAVAVIDVEMASRASHRFPALLAPGTLLHAAPGADAWASVERPLEVDVEVAAGATWGRIVTLDGVAAAPLWVELDAAVVSALGRRRGF